MRYLESALISIIAVFSTANACMRINPGNPGMSAACTQCSQAIPVKTTDGAGAKPFATDTTTIVNGCSVRTLTCTGTMANVELNGGDGTIADTDPGQTPGTVTIPLTCNAAGTAWLFMNIPITECECSSVAPPDACQMCGDTIEITTLGAGSKAFASDTTTIVNGCAVRTLVCTGTNANVEFNNMDGVIFDTSPGQAPGTVTIELTCNAGGTGWLMGTTVLTQMECASAP